MEVNRQSDIATRQGKGPKSARKGMQRRMSSRGSSSDAVADENKLNKIDAQPKNEDRKLSGSTESEDEDDNNSSDDRGEEDDEDDDEEEEDGNSKKRKRSLERCKKWTDEEDRLLVEAKKKVDTLFEGRGADHSFWSSVANLVPHRTSKQCRERYKFNLDPTINRNPFTVEEDTKIILKQQELGSKWALITKDFPGRTENSLKTRYKSIKRAQEKAWKPEEDRIILESFGMDVSNGIVKKSDEKKKSHVDEVIEKLAQTNSFSVPRTKNAIKMRYVKLLSGGSDTYPPGHPLQSPLARGCLDTGKTSSQHQPISQKDKNEVPKTPKKRELSQVLRKNSSSTTASSISINSSGSKANLKDENSRNESFNSSSVTSEKTYSIDEQEAAKILVSSKTPSPVPSLSGSVSLTKTATAIAMSTMGNRFVNSDVLLTPNIPSMGPPSIFNMFQSMPGSDRFSPSMMMFASSNGKNTSNGNPSSPRDLSVSSLPPFSPVFQAFGMMNTNPATSIIQSGSPMFGLSGGDMQRSQNQQSRTIFQPILDSLNQKDSKRLKHNSVNNN